MRNIKLTIEYDGTGFNGWQIQSRLTPAFKVRGSRLKGKRLKTIQGEIEKALKKLFGKRISLIGAGRTDAGVHAKAQIANFKVNSKLPLANIKNGLNSYLPRHISIVSIEEAPLAFHSRFCSRGKLYKYTILNSRSRSPLLERYSMFVPYEIDIDAMRQAAGYLVGRKDFKSFQAADKTQRSSIRTIKSIDIISKERMIEIFIQADGFLYNMARNIVGTLIEAGRSRIKPDTVREILEKKHRSLAGQTAPAKGLCLEKVIY